MVHLLSSVPQVVESYYFRLGIEGWLVRDPPPSNSMCCVLEQDTLSAAKYWFNTGTQHDWKILNQNFQTNDAFAKIDDTE